MDESRLPALVEALDVPSRSERDAAWEPIRELGAPLVPYLSDYVPHAKHWQCRASILTYVGPYSRTSEAAFRAGLDLLLDRSRPVRHAACALCAYSLRETALPALQQLLGHSDARTSADACAAIDAITHQNHHYFRDRDHSGVVKWDYAYRPDSWRS